MVCEEIKPITLQPFSPVEILRKSFLLIYLLQTLKRHAFIAQCLLAWCVRRYKDDTLPVVKLYLPHLGNKFRANFYGVRAAGTEPTSARRIRWARHVILEYYPLLRGIGVRMGIAESRA
jgi:gamma-glutamyl:cysteine ligase YbdK (ATP-grasp superfamily)